MPTKADLQGLRSLRDKKQREALGLFVVEGEKVITELLATNFPLVTIYATHAWTPPSGEPSTTGPGASPPVIRLTLPEMARASHFPTPPHVLAVGRISRKPLSSTELDRGLTLALDGVQDPGNVGTLLRIADWFGFSRVVLSPDCADLFHQKVINASMGSFARVETFTAELAPALTNVNPSVPILGCDLCGDHAHTLKPLRDAVVVIGSEGRGLSAAVSARLTRRITIPRFGGAESLNAAAAAAIVCDQLRRPT